MSSILNCLKKRKEGGIIKMKRMLLIGCLITILAFGCFGCSSNSNGNAEAAETVEVSGWKPIAIRMYDVSAITEEGYMFFRANTKAWITEEDEIAFLNGDRLRYGGSYALKGMLDAPIIICMPLEYKYAVRTVEEGDYGVTSDQIAAPIQCLACDDSRGQRVDIRVYTSSGEFLYFFPAYVAPNDLETYRAGGNLRFQGAPGGTVPMREGTYLLQAPIITITENVLVGPILWGDDPAPMGAPLE
jgi:hypothetical protein